MIKISVYMPAHNYGRYIRRAIDSVLAQTIDDWELIIIDDGSTDETREILQSYKGHEKIRIIEQENRGLSITNNIAIRLANGSYIMRLDADDYLDENALLVLSNLLDTKSEIGLVYPDYYTVDEDDNVIETVRREKIGEEVELLDLPAHGACTMIRKECLINLEGYREEFRCQDGYDLWLRFIEAYEPYNVNVPLFYYRKHSGSLTTGEKAILDTRCKIKEAFVNDKKNGDRPSVLGLIPVLGKSIYPQAGPFVELNGKPLLWYTLHEALKAKHMDKIVVSSDDDRVLEYAGKFGRFLLHKRPAKAAKFGARTRDIARQVVESIQETESYRPDAVCLLYITTPCRKAHHIDMAIDTLAIFNIDSVVSIQEELSHCFFHRRHGLTPVANSRGNLRAERDAIYRENGSIYLSKVEVIEKGNLLGEQIGHITMLPEESIKINGAYDLWLADKVISDWMQRN